MESSSCTTIATGCARVRAVTCVSAKACDTAWASWARRILRRKLYNDGPSTEDILADLTGSETRPRCCKACFTLTVARTFRKHDWSLLQTSRTIQGCAIRLHNRFREAVPRLGPPSSEAAVDGKEVEAAFPIVDLPGAAYDFYLWKLWGASRVRSD